VAGCYFVIILKQVNDPIFRVKPLVGYLE